VAQFIGSDKAVEMLGSYEKVIVGSMPLYDAVLGNSHLCGITRRSGISTISAPDSSQFRKEGNKVYTEYSLVPYVRKKGKDEEQGYLPGCMYIKISLY
jgi:hypothetical protein